MRKELVNEMVVAASADDVWAIYSSHDLPKLIVKLLPSVFKSIEIVEGDGGLGTVLDVKYPPGSIPLHYREKFITIDNEKRLKEVRQIEDGLLALGCTFYMDSFHILEKDCHHEFFHIHEKNCHKKCIIKSTTVYEVPDELAYKIEPLVTIDSLVGMAHAISKYVVDKSC